MSVIINNLQKLNRYCFFTIFLLFLAPFASYAGQLNGPHNHGAIDMLVYKTANTFELELITSAHHITGFELEPKTSEQKLKLRHAANLLRNPVSLFAMGDNSECVLDGETVDVTAEMLFFHEHQQDNAAENFIGNLFTSDDKKPEEEQKNDIHTVGFNGHSDFRMFYKFDCNKFGQVSMAGFFKELQELERIDIHSGSWVGPVIMTLTPEQPILDMRRFVTIHE